MPTDRGRMERSNISAKVKKAKAAHRCSATGFFGPRQHVVYTAQTRQKAREKWEEDFLSDLRASRDFRSRMSALGFTPNRVQRLHEVVAPDVAVALRHEGRPGRQAPQGCLQRRGRTGLWQPALPINGAGIVASALYPVTKT